MTYKGKVVISLCSGMLRIFTHIYVYLFGDVVLYVIDALTGKVIRMHVTYIL